MTFTVKRLRVQFTGHSKSTLLHFVTFHFGRYRFCEFSDDGHKTEFEAKAFGRKICGAVNHK